MDEVKLHGAWISPFSRRIEWILKIKGIPYEYVEENIFNNNNKSPELLKYNPVHKKVSVLLHAGKPLCESMIIVEYIDQIWPQNPLLPSHPYDRALARFWVKYAEDKSSPIWELFGSSGEELEKAKKETLEFLKVVEDRCFLGEEKNFFGGENINIVDITFGAIVHWLGIVEDVIEVKLLEHDKFPHLHSWINNFRNVPTISENLPDRDKMLAFIKDRRE